jgi:hypothetical protein
MFALRAQDLGWTGTNSLAMPQVGEHILRVLSPQLLELTLITTQEKQGAPVSAWDFVGPNYALKLPSPGQFAVSLDGKAIPVSKVGFKQRPLYAPLKKRDLRILSQIYLQIQTPVPSGAVVEVKNPTGQLWKSDLQFKTVAAETRFNPAIHVNQVGYEPGFPKKAMVGYYLGSLGEMEMPVESGFELLDTKTGKSVFSGPLTARPDRGFTYMPTPYHRVYQADFNAFNTPGIYQLHVKGMGCSYPFEIRSGAIATFARAYALGLYHQRCGTNNALPFTRFTHDACHIAPAEVPDRTFKEAQQIIAQVTAGAKEDPRHTAPQLKNTDASLYPFVRKGKIDVSGGHHDAGDYSKYTINSAGLIHALVFAADNFTGAGALDNLGLPESGDGKSDLLQEAKWEADFLAKMQDTDGGFYFLVYPKTRQYEDNVLPQNGDPQIVWPKNTSATAAATAALAEIGSSPLFRKQFPAEAENFMAAALKGWAFLERAIARYGSDGAYQRLTHYGDEFMHDDELAWAAAALFAATGKPEFQEKLIAGFQPESTKTRRWSWWPMFEGYGCAARTYAFAARNGKLKKEQLNGAFLTSCERLIEETADNHVRFARETAYGTSFPDPNKANKNAGWYFGSERAFDITVAWQLNSKKEYREAVLGNMNYEGGCNPVNVAYLEGLGWRRQREIVHQYAQNDHRVLPPTGIPIGNIQAGFAWLENYKKELGELCYPPDGANFAPYPFYDRWGDSFNTTTEFVVVDQARGLASLAFWMAQTALKAQQWKPITAQISGLPQSTPTGEAIRVKLTAPNLDLSTALITWEARDQEPVITSEFEFTPRNVGEQWIEAEALFPDGRRIFAANKFSATAARNIAPNTVLSSARTATPDVVALYHLDGTLDSAVATGSRLKLSGSTSFDQGNLSWMKVRQGAALRFKDLGDTAIGTIQLNSGGKLEEIRLEAMVYLNGYKAYNRGNAKILSLSEEYNSSLEWIEDKYAGPIIRGGSVFALNKQELAQPLSPGKWHFLSITLNANGYSVSVDGKVIGKSDKSEIANWGKKPATLHLGDFDGYIDEVTVICKPGR